MTERDRKLSIGTEMMNNQSINQSLVLYMDSKKCKVTDDDDDDKEKDYSLRPTDCWIL